MKSSKNIGIIGCGVSGLSVAHLLLEKGYKVSIYSSHHPFRITSDPTFASLYPAASVIPHSVYGTNIEVLFDNSQSFFDDLFQESFPGLSESHHYEVFGYKKNLPWYKRLMANFTLFDDFKREFYPKHPEIPISSGWKFNCYFADWNKYYPALFDMVMAEGATLKIQKLTTPDIHTLPFDVLINCGGLKGAQLFGDDQSLIYRGHLLSIPGAPRLTCKKGHPISYNFSPGKEIYATASGEPQDVYCYSRDDGWVLGGSRQAGHLDKNLNWIGDQSASPYILKDGFRIPSQILKLNKEIIEFSFKISTDHFLSYSAKYGYRFIRNEKSGLRLETEERDGKCIIHNYGHGGAGVTLSWGCAAKVVELLAENI